ncbi:MAG TPA: STAS domain-containing protein [Acidimicrobiales bacterium]|nr:STAS domain-containing protein [Acidimicrobiales bacterium]
MTRSAVEIRAGDDARTAIVAIHDALDIHSAPFVRERLGQVIDQDWRVIIVDLRDVDFMDSTGLGVLIGARRRSQDAGIKLVLARPSRATYRLLAITGMRRHFTITKGLRSGNGTAA